MRRDEERVGKRVIRMDQIKSNKVYLYTAFLFLETIQGCLQCTKKMWRGRNEDRIGGGWTLYMWT